MKKIILIAFIFMISFVSDVAFGAREGRPAVVNTTTGASLVTPVQDTIQTSDVVPQNHTTTSGSRRRIEYAPRGQVLGAESADWSNLSAEQKADMIKLLQSQLAEILKLMGSMIADGTLK
jgi:hypothetical protein